jgi:hypothetical protein
MAAVIYSLCALTCIVCAVMLFRSYRLSGGRLIFWSGLCFVGLTISNLLLVLDRLVLPTVDLSTPRLLSAFVGLLLLLYGLIWEGD